MKDYKPILLALLENKKFSSFPKFEKELEELIKAVFKKSFTPEIEALFQKNYGSTYIQDIKQEVLLRLLQYKDAIVKADSIYKSYLYKVIQNIIYTHLSSNFKLLEKEISFEELKPKSNESEELSIENFLPPVYCEHVESLKINHIFKNLKSLVFSKKKDLKNIEALCYYLIKEYYNREVPLKLLTKSALYKRWERLKPKLKSILEDDPKIIKEVIEKFLSEICEKYGYK